MFVNFSCREIINGIVEASSIWGWFKLNRPFLVCVVGFMQDRICAAQFIPGPPAPNTRSLVGIRESLQGKGHPWPT